MTTTAAVKLTDGGMTLPLEQLRESPTNPRKAFDQVKLGELATSIKANGVLQPLILRVNGKGFEIVDGARRARAAKLAGLAEVPVVVREMTDQQVLEAQVIANLQRADLHPLEEADGYHALTRGGLDAIRISERVGRTAQYVRDRLKLLSLTKEAQKLFREGSIQQGHAVILARLSPADQERAIGDFEADGESPLFVEEKLLFTPEQEDAADGMLDARKAVTPGELQAWVDKHVRFDQGAEHVQFLFPETVAAVQTASELNLKVVRITHETVTPEAVKASGQRIILGRSWQRADGTNGSKTCDRSVTGVIDIGPGRGEAFKVCIDKKRCAVHWGEEIRASKKRESDAAKEGASGEDRYAIAERKRKEQEARDLAERERFKKALPTILSSIAAAVKKAPTGAAGDLGRAVLECIRVGWEAPKAQTFLPLGKTAEDLVRHAAMQLICNRAADHYSFRDFVKMAKGYGVDVVKLVAEASPEKKPAAAAATKSATPKKTNPKPKSKAAKKSRGKRS